jgi:hypothetical protein
MPLTCVPHSNPLFYPQIDAVDHRLEHIELTPNRCVCDLNLQLSELFSHATIYLQGFTASHESPAQTF